MGALYLENHDQPRSINKYIPEEWINDYSKKMLATLFMLLRGTPFIYQGQELGMTNIEMASLEDFDDVATHSQYKRALEYGLAPEQALKAVNKRSGIILAHLCNGIRKKMPDSQLLIMYG